MRTAAHSKSQGDQLDWIQDQIQLLGEVHQGELARLQKELKIAQAEADGLRLVIQSAYMALRGCKGLEMAPHQRDRVRGALVATSRALGIKPVE